MNEQSETQKETKSRVHCAFIVHNNHHHHLLLLLICSISIRYSLAVFFSLVQSL